MKAKPSARQLVDAHLTPEMLEWLRSAREGIDLHCAISGHQWRNDVPGIDGTICVSCGMTREEWKQALHSQNATSAAAASTA
jgi:hypothetical protein